MFSLKFKLVHMVVGQSFTLNFESKIVACDPIML